LSAVLRLTRPPRLDLALAGVLAVVAVTEVAVNDRITPRAPSLVLELGLAGALVLRRTAPLVASAIVAVGCVLDAAVGVDPSVPAMPMIASVAMAYALMSHAPLRRALVGTAVLLAGTTGQVLVANQSLANLTFAYTFLVVFWALGRIVRLRTARAVEAELLVERMRLEREDRARRVAAEERARIAREIHDVIAHSVSVMVVQAGGAQQVVRADPDAAVRGLELIQETGRQAVGELGRLLGVLREGSEELGLAPQPTLEDLPRLIDEAESGGVRVSLVEEGARRRLPAGVELAVYRVIQEALTNTRKHAGSSASATVRLRYGADAVAVEVVDAGAPGARVAADLGTGHGLIGMRERVSTYGGTISAGREATGGFRVTARIPVVAE
jgi:signal transduction histidine kinase